MKEVDIEDLYAMAKKAYGKTLDLKFQLEFLMVNINNFAENSARIKELNGDNNERDNTTNIRELPDESA